MFIKTIVIEGVEGDVEIARVDDGALVTCDRKILAHVKTDDPKEHRFLMAVEVARVVCGQVRDRKTKQMVPNATNSMIHDVLNEIERVAGC